MDVNSNQQSDVLLAFDKEKKTIGVVKGIDEKGELQTVPPKQEHNNDFLKVDKNANLFENFFKNFASQLKDPTRFNFFKVEAGEAEKTANVMQENVKNPTPAGDEILGKFYVEIKEPEKQSQQQSESTKYFIDSNKINWDELKNLGITKEELEKSKALSVAVKTFFVIFINL